MLAELARTDSLRFRVLEPDSDQTKALRSMTRAWDGLVRTRVGLANQLRDQLARLRNGAQGRAGDLEMQARREVVLALVSALEPVVARISEVTIEIRHALETHPDGQTFRSLFIAPDSWLCADDDDCRDRRLP